MPPYQQICTCNDIMLDLNCKQKGTVPQPKGNTMENQIIIEAISECPYCGIEIESISDRNAHALDKWLTDNYGETLEDAARGYEETATGFTWEHGGGYDVTDSDLLGGVGNGERSSRAGDVFQFVYVDSDDKTGHACGECASYM